jgi:hypothetical protein
MSDETIRTVCWTVAFLAAIQGFSIYCVVRLAMTGRGMFERREPEHERGTVSGWPR